MFEYKDLNKQFDSSDYKTYKSNSISACSNISIYFRDLEENLIKYIEKADYIYGCVAWLTNSNILLALSDKKEVSIIVNKEDFLRPDKDVMNKADFKVKYNKLKGISRNYHVSSIVEQLSFCSDPYSEAIRCCGYGGANTNRPRMHNKFLVFCKENFEKEILIEEKEQTQLNSVETNINKIINYRKELEDLIKPEVCKYQEMSNIIPYAVWTGSFNMTKNSTQSLENAIYIDNEIIAYEYYKEWANIFSISEPLNWESNYVQPEYRIGS